SYFALAAQVHENHFWPAIPLLILGATLSPTFRFPAALFSVLFAVNLAIFYGLGRNLPTILPRQIGVDVTVPISVFILAAWGGFVVRASRLIRSPSPIRM